MTDKTFSLEADTPKAKAAKIDEPGLRLDEATVQGPSPDLVWLPEDGCVGYSQASEAGGVACPYLWIGRAGGAYCNAMMCDNGKGVPMKERRWGHRWDGCPFGKSPVEITIRAVKTEPGLFAKLDKSITCDSCHLTWGYRLSIPQGSTAELEVRKMRCLECGGRVRIGTVEDRP